MIILTSVVILQIFSRLISLSLPWTGELSIYSFLALAFLGGAFAYHRGENFRITTFVEKLPPRIRKINDIAMIILSLLIMLIIIYTSAIYVIDIWGIPSIALQWNKAIVTLVVPVGYMLIFVKLCSNLKKEWRKET
ncbi:TRAP transporter small permease [Aquibacillus sediminis]|uniref:TRAP transporter small permease n=1 Tax=Aquibacillus sediminis TaxID=2574734 RepID=UPI003CCC8597